MSNIGSIGGTSAWQNLRAVQRPDPAEMASKLFAKLDTSGQGYLQKSDLQAAFDKLSTNSAASTSNVDSLFSTLDANSDGEVTKQEFSDTLSQVLDQLENQAMSSRLGGGAQAAGGGGAMPPPPPGGGEDDAGFTKAELQDQLSQAGSSDSARTTLLSSVVNNFDKADTDGDGKVSFREAMAYAQSAGTSSTDSASSTTTADGTSSSTASNQDAVAMQILRLLHAYGINGSQGGNTLSVTA